MKDYFENIATVHPSILHNPATGRIRFFSVIGSSITNFAGNNEFLNHMHAHPTEPVMIFVNDYNHNIAGTSIDNKWQRKQGQCAILKKLQVNNFAAIETWMEDCKIIIDDIIAQIDYDIRNDNIVRTFNINAITISQVINTADSFFGLNISFSYLEKFCHSVS